MNFALTTARPVSKALTVVTQREVATAITHLAVSFAASTTKADGDKAAWLEVMLRATETVEAWIAETALESLLWNNPRNPFQPTAQDVRERCEEAKAVFTRAVVAWLSGGEWAETVRGFNLGRPPQAQGCKISPTFVATIAALYLSNRDYRGLTMLDRMREHAVALSREGHANFHYFDPDCIPPDVLPDGYREAYDAAKAAHEERELANAAHEAAERQRIEAQKRHQAEADEKDRQRRREKYGRPATAAEAEQWLRE